jgi:hypothetical protein
MEVSPVNGNPASAPIGRTLLDHEHWLIPKEVIIEPFDRFFSSAG